MYKVFEHMCFAIGLCIRSFVWPKSCCCRCCGFLTLPNYSLRTLQSNLTEITNSRNEAVCFIVCNLDCSDIW